MLRLFIVALAISSLAIAAAGQAAPSALDQGYRDMYNLQFDDAHTVFHTWQAAHPDDPLGAVSDAAAYLFAEFDRLHILESELFVDNAKFESRARPSPDAQAKQAFERQLATADQLADKSLARDGNNGDALFAKVLALGLRGDYAALIEKRDLAGLGFMKNGRQLAEKLLTLHPAYYDAYLAVGVENYLLSLKPAPVRWILHMTGAQTDRAAGLKQLQLTADKGHFLLPYARLLLAVAALRDKNRQQARELLDGLAREFPSNHLYTEELSKLK